VRTHVPRSDFGRVVTEDEVGFERLRQLWNVDVANVDFFDVDADVTGTGVG
jgi:hypothetical protein